MRWAMISMAALLLGAAAGWCGDAESGVGSVSKDGDARAAQALISPNNTIRVRMRVQ